MSDLGIDPVPQQALKALHVQLGQQQPERGIRWRLDDMGAEKLVQRPAMAFGEPLHAHQRTLVAEDGEDRHQQQPPLGKTDAAAHAAVGQILEEADQIRCGGRVFEKGYQGVRSGVVVQKST